MNLHRKLIATAALAALSFTALAQSTGDTADRNFERQQITGQPTLHDTPAASDASRADRRNSNATGTDIGNSRSPTLSNPPAYGQHNANQQDRAFQGQNSAQSGNRENGRNDYRQAGVNGAAGDRRGWNEQRGREGRQEFGERRAEQTRRGGEYRQDYRDHRESRADRGRDFRQSHEYGRGEQFRHDQDHRQAYGGNHNGGFRAAPQHSFQQRSYAQAGGRRFR